MRRGGFAQELQAVGFAQLIIEQAGAIVAGKEAFQAIFIPGGPIEIEPLAVKIAKQLLHQPELGGIVVDEQNAAPFFLHEFDREQTGRAGIAAEGGSRRNLRVWATAPGCLPVLRVVGLYP